MAVRSQRLPSWRSRAGKYKLSLLLAREFAARVASAVPAGAAPFVALTTAYERLRFGATPPSEDEARLIQRSDTELLHQLAALHPRYNPASRTR